MHRGITIKSDSQINKKLSFQIGGWTTNVDAALVELLSRPLEDLATNLGCILQVDSPLDKTEIHTKISGAFNEFLSRLDSVAVALEGYDSSPCTNFVSTLKKSLAGTADRMLAKAKSFETPEQSVGLSDLVMDPLIEVQTAVNNILMNVEKLSTVDQASALSPELALYLSDLRQSLSTAVHTAVKLHDPETVEAILNLEEPLMDIKSELTKSLGPQKHQIIRSILTPLGILQQTIHTVIEHCENQSKKGDIREPLHSVISVIEELKESVMHVTASAELEQITQPPTVEDIGALQSSDDRGQNVINNLQIASHLGQIHFELATILENHGTSGQTVVGENICELRYCIGNAAVEIDKICTSPEPDVGKLCSTVLILEEPLIRIRESLVFDECLPCDHVLLKSIVQPLET